MPALQGCRGSPSADLTVLIGQTFMPKAVPVAVTPLTAVVAESTTVAPSAPTAAVAFSTTPSLPVTENQAHVAKMTPSSVLQWSSAVTSVVGTSVNATVTVSAEPPTSDHCEE